MTGSFGRAALTLAVVLAGCAREEVAEWPPRPVHTVVVGEPDSTVRRTFSGLVEAAEGTRLSAEIGGRVLAVHAAAGERYAAGAVLAELDTTETRNQLVAAEAQWTEAKQTLRRVQQLFETGNAAQGDLETAISQEKAARSNYQSALKRLEDTKLKMPYGGIIGSVEVNEGEIVSAGQPVLTIQGEGAMEFQMGVPAESVGAVEVGQPASIVVQSVSGDPFPAQVKTVAPAPGSNTTYPVELVFTREDPRIREGMDGEAMLELPHPSGSGVIRVPVVCVVAEAGKQGSVQHFVWVVEPGEGDTATVQRRPVNVGKLGEDETLEILDGLRPGQRVVSRGVHHLEPGQEVRWVPSNP